MILTKSYMKKIFCDTLIKLAEKLINTTEKEKNHIIVKSIKKIKIKFMKRVNLMIGWSNQAIKVLI